MSSENHSPLPWSRNGLTVYASHTLAHVETNRFSATVQYYVGCSREEAEANAALIVRAVNNHKKLVHALVSVCDRLEFHGERSKTKAARALLAELEQK